MSRNDDWWDPSEGEEPLPVPPIAVERRRRRAQPTIPWWVLVAGGLVVVLAIALLWVWAWQAMQANKEPPTIAITPTFTPAPPTATPTSPSLPTPPPPTSTPVPPTPTTPPQVAIGGWVKVIGSSDAGLSFRAGPGLENVRLKVLNDGAVLKVLDGPRESDGYNWWRLEEYVGGQAGVIGWAVEQFLEPTSAP